jgi:hypothetical protein
MKSSNLGVIRTSTKNFIPTDTQNKYTVWLQQAFDMIRMDDGKHLLSSFQLVYNNFS